MEQRKKNPLPLLLLGSAAAVAACGDTAHEVGGNRGALAAECAAAEPGATPDGAWVCPDARTIECASGTGRADPGVLYVPESESVDCVSSVLTVSDQGPFTVGDHTITVQDQNGDQVCEAKLTVTDGVAPVATAHTIQLWPPNHKFHSIAVSDCVSFTDACQGDVTGEFIWASSDEPVDDKGDGHHAPDILIDDCGHVQVRAERAGPKNGRVYRLGVRVVDGAGNATESECAVIVDHDQRGVEGADDGESYRLTFDGADGGLACDGESDDPTPPSGGDGADGAPDGDDGADGSADGSTGGDGSDGTPADGSADGSDDPPPVIPA